MLWKEVANDTFACHCEQLAQIISVSLMCYFLTCTKANTVASKGKKALQK